MVPPLLALNAVVWGAYYLTGKSSQPPKLEEITKKTPVSPDNIKQDPEPEHLIKHDFATWLEREYKKDPTLTDLLWKEGILNPDEVVWCNGYPLVPQDPEDMEKFEEIKELAYLDQIYEGKNFEEGGLDELKRDWFMMKGCSRYGAEQLILQGLNPWEFNPEW